MRADARHRGATLYHESCISEEALVFVWQTCNRITLPYTCSVSICIYSGSVRKGANFVVQIPARVPSSCSAQTARAGWNFRRRTSGRAFSSTLRLDMLQRQNLTQDPISSEISHDISRIHPDDICSNSTGTTVGSSSDFASKC